MYIYLLFAELKTKKLRTNKTNKNHLKVTIILTLKIILSLFRVYLLRYICTFVSRIIGLEDIRIFFWRLPGINPTPITITRNNVRNVYFRIRLPSSETTYTYIGTST